MDGMSLFVCDVQCGSLEEESDLLLLSFYHGTGIEYHFVSCETLVIPFAFLLLCLLSPTPVRSLCRCREMS